MTGRSKQILKKRAQRRELYLGENIRAFLMLNAGRSIGGEVISLSESGLAFVCEPQVDAELAIGLVVDLKFYFDARRFFTTKVEIRNKSLFQSQGLRYLRVGVSAHGPQEAEQEESIRQKTESAIAMGPDVCGYVEIENPIFFDEVEYFRISAVHADCILVSPLDNRHFLLPGQPILANFSIPGSKVFQEEMIVSSRVPDQDCWAGDVLMLNFAKKSPKTLSKFAKFALIHKPHLHVKQLQESGFPIPYLDFLLRVQFAPNDVPTPQMDRLQTAAIAPTQYVSDGQLKRARILSFYRQSTLIATMKLNFVRDVREGSALYDLGIYNYQFYRKSVVEILDFRHHPEYPLPSILVPILQQALRASIQAEFSFLVFECTLQTESIFHRLGFATLKTPNALYADRRFVSLGIKQRLADLGNGVHRDTWERVYKRLHSYLNRKHPLAKNVA